MPVPHVHPEKIEQVHHEGQVPRDVVENETVSKSGGAREPPKSGREREELLHDCVDLLTCHTLACTSSLHDFLKGHVLPCFQVACHLDWRTL